MMPEPTTAASSIAVPMNSPTSARMSASSRAAIRSATRLRCGLGGPHEGTGECAFNLRRKPVDIDTTLREKGARVIDGVDPPWFDVDIRESRVLKLAHVLAILERSGDAANPEFHIPTHVRWGFAADHDIGHGESTSRFQ